MRDYAIVANECSPSRIGVTNGTLIAADAAGAGGRATRLHRSSGLSLSCDAEHVARRALRTRETQGESKVYP